MRGAVDRRVLAVVSREVIARRYCSAGRGRGRGAPAAPGAAAAGAAPGRGQAPASSPASASVAKSVGRGIPAAGRGAGANVAKAESTNPASSKAQVSVGKPAKDSTERTLSEAQQNAQPQETTAQAGTKLPSSEASEAFAVLVQSCVRSGLAAEVDYVYRGIQAAHVPLSLQTCQMLLEVYIQLGNVQRMDSIYSEMRDVRAGVGKPGPSSQEKTEASQIMGAMINYWHGRGLLQQVDLAYRAMHAAQLPVGVHTYRVLIDTYSRLGQYEAMDTVYSEMRKSLPSASPVHAPTAPPAPGTAAATQQIPGHEQAGQPYVPQYPTVPGVYVQQTYPPYPVYQQWPYQTAPNYPYATYGVQPAYYPPSQFTYPQVGVQSPIPVYAPPQVPPYPGQAYPTATVPPRPVTPVGTSPSGAQVPPVAASTPAAQLPSVVAPAAPATRPQATSATQTTTKPVAPKRGGFELQPKALELLKQSEYNELLKQGRGYPATSVSEAPATTQVPPVAPVVQAPYPPVYGGYPPQVPVSYVHYRPTGYYAPPLVAPIPGVPPPPVQPRPVVQRPVPSVPPSTPAVPVSPPQQAAKPVAPPVTKREKVEVPKPAPAAQKEVKAEPPQVQQDKAELVKSKQAVKADVKPAAKKAEHIKAATPTKAEAIPETKPEVKPADAKLKPDEKVKAQLKQEVAKAAEATVSREEEAAKAPSLKLNIGRTKSALAAAATDVKTPPESPKSPSLKLDRDRTERAASESPKSPSLKLDVTGKASKAADTDTQPPSPSLKLGLGKKEEKLTAAAGEIDADEPKSPKLKLGLKKQKPSLPQAMDASEVTEERTKEPSLPSIKKMLARGRGKALSADPAATLLGVHTPSEILLRPTEEQEDEQEAESLTNLPALPFESRLAGKGRGKAIAAPDPEAEVAKKKRLEEAAARALSILETAAGKAQLSANLERRKKRFSEQFSFGTFQRRGGETRIQVVSSKKPKAKRVATLEELKDDPINYIAPEEFMAKGETLTEFEEAVKGAIHRHFMFDLDPEAAMEEFGTNPDIDDKPLPTIEETLEKSKPQIMAQDGLNEDQWQEAMEDVKKRSPHIESLVRAYAGPKKKNAKQKNKELHDMVSKLPPYARPELADFAKRAARTLQGNPDWNHHAKVQLLNRVVKDASKF